MHTRTQLKTTSVAPRRRLGHPQRAGSLWKRAQSVGRLSAARSCRCPPATHHWQEGVWEVHGQGVPAYSPLRGSSRWLWKGCDAQPGFGASLAKGVSPGWAGRWHHPDASVTSAGPVPVLGQQDSQPRAGRIFQLGSAPSHPPSTFKSR